MKFLFKIGAVAGAAWAGYEGMLWWRKKHSFTPIVAGHGYTVVLGYSGSPPAGEGPPSATDIQAALNAGAAGVGTMAVSTVSLDATKKTITYLFGALASFNGTAAALAPPGAFPAAFGSLSVALVQDTGSIPVTPAAAAAA